MTHIAVLKDLQEAIGVGYVQTEPDIRYTTDWRHLFHARPLAVVLPANTQEVAAVMRICHQHAIGVVPFGGNTGLAGGATADASGQQLVLSLERLRTIRAIDVYGETMTVEAGCIVQEVQEAARTMGYEFPVAFAAQGSAQIGGMIATNAGGINVIRYGMARHQVLGLEVVLPNGQILDGLRQLRKDNAGLDLLNVFIGSEGCLGVITAAVLRMVPQSTHVGTAFLAFSSVDSVLELLRDARKNLGDSIQAFELISGSALELVQKHLGKSLPFPHDPTAWYVLLEVASVFPQTQDVLEQWLESVLEKEWIVDALLAQSLQQRQEFWNIRESLTESEAREGKSIKHDISIPIHHIPLFIQTTTQRLQAAFPNTRLHIFGHVGDGNLHFNVICYQNYDTEEINRLVHDEVVSYAGSISAEHGIGQYRVAELYRTKSAAELSVAETIKRALDPLNIMNPGKVFHFPRSSS